MSSPIDWKQALETWIGIQRVISRNEAIYFCKKMAVSPRAVDQYLNELHRQNEVIKPYRGIYATNNQNDPVTPAEILPFINKDATLGLDSVFVQKGGQSPRTKDRTFAVVPSISKSPPKVGTIETNIGKVIIFSLNTSDFSKLTNQKSGRYRAFTAESAIAHAIKADKDGRSKYTLESKQGLIVFPKADLQKLLSTCQKIGVNFEDLKENLFRFDIKNQKEISSVIANSQEQNEWLSRDETDRKPAKKTKPSL